MVLIRTITDYISLPWQAHLTVMAQGRLSTGASYTNILRLDET
jgi:hypothetical protein